MIPLRSASSLATLSVLSAALLGGCSRKDDAKAPCRSVILITIDTLRADHLGCYGYDRATSPNLDQLAAEGARFDRALVSIPRTTQSLASILTGRTPASHTVRHLQMRLPQAEITVAERFLDAKFDTGAVVAIPFFQDKMGFGQGFGGDFELLGKGADVRADVVTDRALGWIEQHRDRPFFLWVHYRDPHAPYYPPARFLERLDPDYQGDVDIFHYWPVDATGEALPEWTSAERQEMKGRHKFGVDRYDDEQVRRAITLYDGEIAFVDEQVGRLFESLRGLGIYDDTAIVVTADHGESFGEHGVWFDHGETLYDEELRVPLIIRVPSLDHVDVEDQVAAIDVAPTLLELFGLAAIPSVQGRSLLPQLRAKATPRGDHIFIAESGEPIFWEYNPRFAGSTEAPQDPAMRLRLWSTGTGNKLIYDPAAADGANVEFFQPTRDRSEHSNIASDPRAAPIIETGLQVLRRIVAKDLGITPPPIDPEMEKRLREQGYFH